MNADAGVVPAHAGLLGRLRLAAADIKLAHSVFALPFAVLAAVLAGVPRAGAAQGGGWARFGAQLGLVVVCMVLARTWAMLVNRLADRRFDALNPRTARRVMASGLLPARDGLFIALGDALLFVLATSLFWVGFGNPWPLLLSVPVLAWIAFYSFTKRLTAWCHVFLGGALAASPLAAALAVHPAALALAGEHAGTATTLWALAAMVVCWVAGFDVVYALQDVRFDREHGLRSIPARLGPGRAILVSRGLHAAAFAFLILAATGDDRLGALFWIGVAGVGGLLVAEHVILARRGEAGLDMAFFTINGVVSCVLGAAGVADVLLGA